MNRRLAFPLALASGLALSACASTASIHYDADPSADFSALRTYSWAYQSLPQGANPLLGERVRQAIESNPATRGYSEAAPGDFAIGFTLGSRDRVEVSTLGGWGGYYRPWGGWAGSTVDVQNVTDGTLTIDIYDAKSKKPIWHGTATQQVDRNTASEENVNAVVAQVLAKFPPPAK